MLATLRLLTLFLLSAHVLSASIDLSFDAHHQLQLQDADTSHSVFDLDHHQQLFVSSPPASIHSDIPARRKPGSLTLKAVPTTVYRPRSLEALHNARLRSLRHAESPAEKVEWDAVEVLGPDVRNHNTLVQLSRMSGNAYALPGQKNWYEVDSAWNTSFPFGWEESDGFRGHVFMSSDNSTIVLSIKGTTLQGPTSKLDKFNDNLLFSCCCARVDITWVFRTVCDCYTNGWRCDATCLTNALIQDSLFYSIGVRLIDDLRHLYPHSNVWLVGHSLGGALASLLGATYGIPAVAFESPGERLAAQRLHLPLPPPPSEGAQAPVPITHVYHTADPIPQGTCTGFGSPCAQAGYALETRCHLGQSIVYDTVSVLGWRVDVRKHVIRSVIHEVIELEDVVWDDGGMEGAVPEPKAEVDCVDCFKWEFGDFKDD